MSSDFRKRVLMGTKFESTVNLKDYGNAEVRVRALPDLTITQIEERTGETAIGVMKRIDEVQRTIQEKYKDVMANETVDTSTYLAVSDDMMKMFTPSIKRFLADLAKAGIVLEPDPDCKCKGKEANCPVCGPGAVIDALRGTATAEIGIAVLTASLASWQEVEDFFSPTKGASGPES